ncbi:hypothetical protein [Mycobacterium parmense]|nr:hypothetical protein [Mycobacterium parmense]MCV7352026.1 hypothetical protein [Mycobacterium parmense]
MNTNDSDKGTSMGEAHGYTPVYERWLEPMRNDTLRLLEIGVCDPRMPGASLKGWYEYFPKATIFGYDIKDAHRFDNDRITTFVGDQSDRADLARLVENFGGEFDIIIDDGSHNAMHQQVSLAFLFPYLKPGGQYIIEDLHVAPNTQHLLRSMQTGLPGERAPGSGLGKRVRAFSGGVRAGWLLFGVFKFWPRRPYITEQEIARIHGDTERLDLACDDKLARFIKRRQG